MSSLSSATLDIQNALISADCIEDFRVSHVEDEDGEQVRVAYTLRDSGDIDASEKLFAGLEERHGLKVARSGASGDGFYIIYAAA